MQVIAFCAVTHSAVVVTILFHLARINMNKNTLIGGLLIVGIMVWWMSTAPKQAQAPAQTAPQKTTESASTLELPKTDAPKELTLGGAQAPVAVADSAVADSAADTAAVAPKIEPRDVTIETERFTVVIANRGARIKSVIPKVLADSTGAFPELLADTSLGALSLVIDGANLDQALFAVEAEDKVVVSDAKTIDFTFADANGNKVVRSYGFTKDGAAIRQVNRFEGFKPKSYELAWNGGMRETEYIPEGRTFGGNYFFSEVVYNENGSIERETFTSGTKQFNEDGKKLAWAGMRRKYIAMTMQFDSPVNAKIDASAFEKKESEHDPGTYKIAVKDNFTSDSLAYNFMVLPLEWQAIKAFDVGYEKIIVSGWEWCGADTWFVAICGFLLWLLKAIYSVIPNYGVAIIIITLIVRGITTPLTAKQLRSSKQMAKLKPELDAINVKFRADPQGKQRAIMELYAKNKINPMSSCTGGCFPLLLQMPVFFGLFMILGRSVELRGMPFFGWITDLSHSDVIFDGISIPYVMPMGIAILPIVMVFTTYFQTKQSMISMPDPAQAKMMSWMMPAMMFLFSAVMPSGLVLYWIVSNLWGIAQYRIMNRDKIAEAKAKKANGKKVIDAEVIKKK